MPLVLIIDSEAEVAATLSAALQARGLSTKIIADGADGLNAARDDNPDAIVLCVELSRVSGYSICNKLKKSPELAKIPLILTSDKATEETFEQHKKLKTRAEQYLKKPYDLDQMLGLIAQYVDLGDAAEDELEVSLDDVDVDGDGADGLEAAFDDANPQWSGQNLRGGATTVMQLPDDFAAQMAEEAARADALKRAIAAPSPSEQRVSKPTGAVSSDGQSDRMRDEVKQLRQKVQTLERTLQEKEQEFTDRLLQESTRSRESIDLKKRLNQIEREIDKHKSAAERAELRAADAEAQLADLRGEVTHAGQAKDALSEKVGQLVDKVKSLASERDALRGEIEGLLQKQGQAEDSIAQAEQVRAKAKKAVDIAMQLLNDTGLMN